MNDQLKAIYDEDQDDRSLGNKTVFDSDFKMRDRARREQVEKIIQEEGLVDPDDYYNAGMVFQHGEVVEDYLKANELFKKAADLGLEKALHKVAASWDRYLIHKGEPFQKYGTNFRKDGPDTPWYVYPIDPATTDEERSKYNVRSLKEIYKMVEEMNAED